MSNKPLNIGEEARVQMPMKTVASLIFLVAMGVFAYTELTARLVSLETSRELFENDLLKKSEQVPYGSGATFFIGRFIQDRREITINSRNEYDKQS